MSDIQRYMSICYTLALILRAVIVIVISVVVVVVIFVSEAQIQATSAGVDFRVDPQCFADDRRYSDGRTAHWLSRHPRNPNQAVIVFLDIFPTRIDVTFPC